MWNVIGNNKKMHINTNSKRPNFKSQANAQGFTLIEIAIVILISAMMFVPLLNIYQTYYRQQLIDKTRNNIDFSQSLIATFSSSRYPCPADPALGPADANYGLERIDAGGNCLVTGAIISVPGAKTPLERVVIGAIPIRTIRAAATNVVHVPDNTALDAWGNKLLYAVTASQANGTTYSSDKGQIAAIDENFGPTAGIDRDGHFVVLSHGANGNGAYHNSGAIVSACGAGTKESENCDADSTFMSALGFYEGSGVNPDYFDDIAYFVQKSDNELWASVAPGSNDIYNKNKGNVGIKTATPAVKLDVAGELKAANNTKVARICDYGGTKCFDVNKISGTGMSCGANEVMQGISNATPVCVPLPVAPPTDKDCSAQGKWVRGISSNGTVICYP